MSENASVIVFPSDFAQNKMNILVSNIKKVLKLQNQKYSSIKRDGPIIVIEANDPVFASSSINLLFGIQMIAIAKKVKNDFESLILNITKLGSSLLLKGEKFYVKVEGQASGFLPADVELAATSSLIEKTANLNAKPGSKEDFDKLLYTYITKSNAYVCIFTDKGHDGIPYNSQKDKTVCCIYDELSAVSCIESIKQGFEIKLIICYRKDSELLTLVKMLNQIIPRVLSAKIQIEFYKIPSNNSDYLLYVESIIEVLCIIAITNKINRISLSISPLIFPLSFVDSLTKKILEKKLIPHFPLYGLDSNIFNTAKLIGLEKYIPKIKKLSKLKMKNTISQKQVQNFAKNAITTKQVLTIKAGPNNVHDILDSLKQDH